MEIEWFKLRDLATQKFKSIPKTPGIYFMRWVKDGTPVSIPRLAGSDNRGILYVGSTVRLRRRIRDLWKGINGKIEAHTIGRSIIFCKVSEIISMDDYEISWEELETHGNAKGQEWTALKLYANQYKEPPPFNLMIYRKLFAVWGIFKWGESRWAYEPDEFVKSIIDPLEKNQ
jgi:hypothetical protein